MSVLKEVFISRLGQNLLYSVMFPVPVPFPFRENCGSGNSHVYLVYFLLVVFFLCNDLLCSDQKRPRGLSTFYNISFVFYYRLGELKRS